MLGGEGGEVRVEPVHESHGGDIHLVDLRSADGGEVSVPVEVWIPVAYFLDGAHVVAELRVAAFLTRLLVLGYLGFECDEVVPGTLCAGLVIA